jgi:hypothetical protein
MAKAGGNNGENRPASSKAAALKYQRRQPWRLKAK